jgi:16S rRNA C967 or C1407 C5-methylase (RsmB/RsmF family)
VCYRRSKPASGAGGLNDTFRDGHIDAVTVTSSEGLDNLWSLCDAAARAVRPGGRLVYSVCTLTRPETIGVDEWARSALPGFIARPVSPAPWRPHGRGAIVLPSDARSDGMFVLVLDRSG